MAPGSAGLPAAEREVPVAGPIAEHLAWIPARTRARIRLGLRAFELSTFPWRFSRAGIEARTEYLAELESLPGGLRRELFLLLKALVTLGYARAEPVRAAVGYEARCATRDGGSPPPDLVPLGPPDHDLECDVAIVGSGAGGAVAAATLAEAGLDVVVLEAGPHLNRKSYPTDPLAAMATLYRDGGLSLAEGRPMIPLPLGRAVGGTTVINSGTCFRAPGDVLARWRDELGIGWAPDLDAEYEEAERFLAVAPVDVERMGRNGQLCMEGAAALGASHGPIRRNAGSCVQCSSCPTGCRLDAKRAMHVSYLPRAAAAGARVHCDLEARRILARGGTATGVECLAAGKIVRVRSRAVVCAGGAVGTPQLLLRSGIEAGPVGRNLHIHPACWIGARYDEEVRGWDGVMQSAYVDEWHDRGLLLEATFTPLAFGAHWLAGVGREYEQRLMRYDHVGSIGVHLSDRSTGRVGLARDGSARVTYRLTREEAEMVAFGIARAAEVHFAAGAREVYTQVGRMPVLRPGETAAFESLSLSPAELRLEAFHPMGTASMGADPATSVVGADGQAHTVDGLYVTDAALLPSSLGVNPMMTVIACAARISRDLAERLSG